MIGLDDVRIGGATGRRRAATESVRSQCEAGGSNAAQDVEPNRSHGACEDDRMNGGDNNDKTMEIDTRMNTTGQKGLTATSSTHSLRPFRQ
jgi:hypothetical protein